MTLHGPLPNQAARYKRVLGYIVDLHFKAEAPMRRFLDSKAGSRCSKGDEERAWETPWVTIGYGARACRAARLFDRRERDCRCDLLVHDKFEQTLGPAIC